MILSEEQKKEFNDTGFIVMKSFYDEEEMKEISEWLSELHDKTPKEGEEAKYYEKSSLEEWKPLTEDDPPYQPENEYMLLEADPGDVIFFDSYVPHGSPANTGKRSLAIYPPNQSNNARTAKSFRV